MKYIKLIIILFAILGCKKNETIAQVSDSKDYIFDYHKEKNISDDISNFFGKKEFQLENYLSEISREQYIKDSVAFKNEYSSKEDMLEKSTILEVPYGKIKFVNNDNQTSDLFSKYNYSGFSKLLNSHIINISLYEGNATLLLKNDKYNYRFLENEPIISSNKKFLLTYKNNDGLNSTLSIYTINDKNLNLDKTIWSEENLIENAYWNSKNTITIKLRSLNRDETTYYIVNNNQSNSKNQNINVDEFMKMNLSTPQNVTNSLIFKKDNTGKLSINNDILTYIKKNTTATENSYSIALSNYVQKLIINLYDENDKTWKEEELFKIIAYASNTTDPLFKKYWKENFSKWDNGKAGNILGFCNVAYHDKIWNKLTANFENNKYYNLNNLEDMIYYASEFDSTGAP